MRTTRNARALGILLLALIFCLLAGGGPASANGGELYTYSAHLDKIMVKPGQFVHKGDVIGIVGSTGYVPNPSWNKHLHFAVRNTGPSDESCWDGSCWLNPDNYLGQNNGWLASPVPGTSRCGAPFGGASPIGGQDFHNAVDLACQGAGKEVLAVADGYVVHADWWPSASQKNHLVGHGLTVVIHHTDQQGASKEVRAVAGQPSSPKEIVETTVDTVAQTTSQLNVSQIPWASILLIVGLGVLALVLRSWGLTYRVQAGLVGLGLLVYAWILPQFTTWLPSPFGPEDTAQVIDFYGDVRKVAEGQTAQIYSVPAGTEVKSVVPGTVVEAPWLFAAQGNQVWLKVGNGLYVQYAGLSQIKVKPGQKIQRGQVIGTSTEQFRLGISSKAPELFTNPDDRSYGWVNPEKYLGQTLMSGTRQEESSTMQWGIILLMVALLWPSNYLKRLVNWLQLDLVAPYGSDWFYARARLLVVAAIVLAVGLVVDSPWLKWLSIVPLIVAFVYFLDRRLVRNKIRNGQRINLWWRWLFHSLQTSVWVSWVFFLVIGGLVDPTLTYAKNVDYQLSDLPNIVTPSLLVDPSSVEPILSEATSTTEKTPATTEKTVTTNPKEITVTINSSDLPEFDVIYWNGSETRFWIDPDVWDAAVTAWKKYPGCDPRLSVVVAHSESPRYTNYAEENYATAAGRWQFIRTTWESLWRNSETIPERTDDYAAAEAFCRYAIGNGMAETINTSEAAFVRDFAEEPPVWNAYPPQAEYVWRAYHELVKQLPLPPVDSSK